ncbi:apoptosis-enhancing nuclease isoform X2 [Anas platyrhynchos]|uniref:apoptosis-enhancing nuclease isoform X2 n=1 Tax=Anas platyrhynchos TaxID=8839 RepID=UPI003AF2CCF8
MGAQRGVASAGLARACMPPGKGQMVPLPPPRAPPPAPKGAQGPPGSKKRSRRHQRYLERRALLEHRGLLRPPRGLPETSPSCGKVPKTPNGTAKTLNGLTKTLNGTTRSLNGPAKTPNGTATSPNGTAEDATGTDTPTGVPPLRPTKYVAIDCEMVGTGPRGRQSELARCSVVGYHGDVIYDKYVRPQLPVVDYRTRWSGVTKGHLRNAIPFRAAQAEILKILKDKIVVGHAIHNDFQALKYFHPKERTRDTSRIPLLNQKAGLPLKASASLKSLAKHLLHKKIQVGCRGHSSVEDAQTAMELYRLVEVQWETELARSQPARPPSPPTDPSTDSNQYLDDQYWPTDLPAGSP